MKRRTFLTAPAAAAATPRSISPGLPFEKLRAQYRADLFEDFLPFMERHVIDREYGGFMCNTDRDGTNLDRNKTAWYEGRGIWVYSFLYNHLAKEKKYLEVAHNSVELILKTKPAGDGLWPRLLTREGAAAAPPDPSIYGDLFIAEGLAEYAKASGEAKYRELAKQILLKCVRIYDRPDYLPEIGETYLGRGARPFPGARIQGVWMVLVRIATQMLETGPDPEIDTVASRAVDAVLNHHFNPAFQLNNELLNHDLSRPANEYAQLVYTGHAIETLWMLMAEAVRRKNGKLFAAFAERFRRHVEVAWDDVYGGVFRGLPNVDKNIWNLDKVLWAQEEVLIGALCVLEHTGAPWAADMFTRMYDYVQARYPLKQYGFPLWIVSADRKVTFQRHSNRVENFHHPRHLMLNLLALDRILARGGKTSGLFA
ncbi:MAG TPA: AGE family epimerase/isomerase [Bryobacteraceae bacterium]|nr:AGE family epimerase/isomerase [Bryobacteraceae bacterium]